MPRSIAVTIALVSLCVCIGLGILRTSPPASTASELAASPGPAPIVAIETLAGLRAYSPDKSKVIWFTGGSQPGAGRQGLFCWLSSDLAAEVSKDTESGIYVAPSQEPSGASGAWARQFDPETIRACWFKTSENTWTDAIQGALDFAQSRAISRPSSGATYVGSIPTVVLPQGDYELQSPIRLGTYVRIDGRATILKPAESFPSSSYAFEAAPGRGWDVNISKVKFDGFRKAVAIDNKNLDQGKIDIGFCEFRGGREGIYLNAQSSITTIHDCKFDSVATVLEVAHGDHVAFQRNWIKQGTLSKPKSATIINRGVLHVTDMLGVPAPPGSGATETAWINNYASLVIQNSRFGGEKGSKTAVNNFATADTSYPVTSNAVIVRDSQLYSVDATGGHEKVQVRLFAVPNQLIIAGNRGVVDSLMVGWGSGVDPARLFAAAGSKEKRMVRVVGNSGSAGANHLPSELASFAPRKSRSP